jgi:hypothetical protein
VGRFLLVYSMGRDDDGAGTDEEVMVEWIGWLSRLGSSVLDDGSSFDLTASVSRDGVVIPSEVGVAGYTIVAADSLESAVELASSCPVTSRGGVVHVLGVLDD